MGVEPTSLLQCTSAVFLLLNWPPEFLGAFGNAEGSNIVPFGFRGIYRRIALSWV